MRLALAGIFIFLFVQCSENNSNDKSNQREGISDSLRNQWINIIKGGWVEKKYAENLQRSHSPHAAYDSSLIVQEFYIDVSEISGDTIRNSKGIIRFYDNSIHLGREQCRLFFFRDSVGAVKINIGSAFSKYLCSLAYKISGRETLLELEVREKNSHEL